MADYRAPASPRSAPAYLDEADVVAWLRQNPDLLTRHPDLCEVLLPPSRAQSGDNVVDLQRFMVQRLQGELARASDVGAELLDASRQNMSATQRVHAAVLALLEAGSFEHLIHIATQDWTDLLEVDTISLCVEGDPHRMKDIITGGVFVLPHGAIDTLIGALPALLRDHCEAAEWLYGPAANLVRSDALARLDFGPTAPQAMLALGSREPDKFQPNQGTELLQFIAGVLGRSVRAWLDLPQP
ncbi:DUF484 family protein [uncultured Ferrovibrio sp.]|jgi:uncharacterized protein YigA (DUF484 family)|uniref:DUF484 family protein n=1 Tax=uncultured Ferrovibrio sp. TaxID=1576913 RepID=UPI0026108F1D|nr:DUF484 family protein [uncultured Ferrovibrio sp.]